MKKLNTYCVMADIELFGTNIEIEAKSLEEALEEALEKSKELDINDFIDIKGQHNDDTCHITGLWEDRR